jgi:RNA polymerase sigma-70 factor, ECF subfamily
MPSDLSSDETKLIREAQAGQTPAFSELINRYQTKIFSCCLRILGDREEACDAAQDVFIAAFRQIRSFRFESSFFTWAYRIALNLCYKRARMLQRQRARSAYSLDDAKESGEGTIAPQIADPAPGSRSTAQKEENIERLRLALHQLGKQYYDAIVLHDLEGLSYEESARALSVPIGTVMSRLFRGRLLLKKRLEQQRC